MKDPDEKLTAGRETKSTQTESIINAGNNYLYENKEKCRKGTTLILEDSKISGLIEKEMSRNKKIKVRYFPRVKSKNIYRYAIHLLKKKPENIILHLGINDEPYRSGANILKDLSNLKDFILF